MEAASQLCDVCFFKGAESDHLYLKIMLYNFISNESTVSSKEPTFKKYCFTFLFNLNVRSEYHVDIAWWNVILWIFKVVAIGMIIFVDILQEMPTQTVSQSPEHDM